MPFDSRYRPSTISTTNGTITPQSLAYTYDEAGNISQIVDAAASETLGYAYDDLNRITGMTVNTFRRPLTSTTRRSPMAARSAT